ncbi:thiamine phosphate synthase [Rummeliibacillus sp. JY-2-4R]
MRLMAVTDNVSSVRALASTIIEIKNKVDFIQIREKTKSPQDIMTLLEYLEEGGVEKEKIILNDRLDIALLMNIPTVHLPEKGLPVRRVKQFFPHIRVGKSVHSFEGAEKAELDGADYVVYGHCFETNSKKGRAPNGIDPIIQMKRNLSIPVFAIGGITCENVHELRVVRADGVAVLSGIFSAENPLESANQYKEAIVYEKEL